jgi:ubiquinone/menaquinone biosynthesis C-methylase UbiE
VGPATGITIGGVSEHEGGPAAGDAQKRADIEFHAATAHAYEETLDPLFAAHDALITRPLLDKLERLAPGRDALDIGCGTGRNVLRLADRGFRVHGIDHSEAMLTIAERKVREGGFADRVELRPGDVRELPFADASFDVAMATGVLHHLPDLAPAVAEAARVLRTGGVLCLADPCVGTTPALQAWELMRRARRGLRAAGGAGPADPKPAEPLEAPDHEEGSIDVGELRGALDAAGFEADIEHWTFFGAAHKLGPLWLQKAIVYAGSRPWRRRGGNMVFVVARRV